MRAHLSRSNGSVARMRAPFIGFLSAALVWATLPHAYAADIEKPEAIDGSTYAVAPAAINYIANSASFIRFYNGGLSTATISMTIVNPSTGATVGSVVNISVPAHAAKIMDMRTLLGSCYANANVADGGAYVVYLKSSEPLAGYQHLLFNGNNYLFENNSSCANLLNASTLASDNSLALLGVTTNNLSVGSVNYPSSIVVHNYSTASATYKLSVFDANSGAFKGDYDLTVPANNSRSVPFYNSSNVSGSLQTMIGWTTTSSELYASIVITDTGGAIPQAAATISYTNVGLGGSFNMTTACAINAPASTAISTTTTFDGSIASGSQTGTFSVTVQANGSASSAREGIESAKAAIEKPQATLTASGTLRIGGATITLTGTYDSVTRKLLLNGGGYTFAGGVMGGITYFGTFTGPGGTSGGFSGAKSSSTASRGFCGSLSGHDNDGPVNATFSLVIAGNGTFAGYAADAGGGVRLTGTVTGTTLTGYGVDSAGYGATITGTVSGNSLTGTYGGNDTEGTFTATSCGTF